MSVRYVFLLVGISRGAYFLVVELGDGGLSPAFAGGVAVAGNSCGSCPFNILLCLLVT